MKITETLAHELIDLLCCLAVSVETTHENAIYSPLELPQETLDRCMDWACKKFVNICHGFEVEYHEEMMIEESTE